MGGIGNMLNTAMIFGDHMILQRQKPILIWGMAEPWTEVKVTLGKAKSKCRAKANGKWGIVLPAREAERGLTMRIVGEDSEIVYKDVCVGEVWIAGGQSNMEYYMAFDGEFEQTVQEERNEEVRFFGYPKITYEGQLEDYDYREYGIWRLCTKEDLPYFSAVGYYFANQVQKSQGVPVGIVGCNWGGTTACSWMDPALLSDNEGKVWLEDYEKAMEGLDVEKYKQEYPGNPQNDTSRDLVDPENIRIMKVGISREEQLHIMEAEGENFWQTVIGPYYERRPGGLYETMLKKIVPYGTRGIIWYQGESDDEHPDAYSVVFGKMIENWRKLWGEELPFLFVQLAPFGEWFRCSGEKYPRVRTAQEYVSRTVPNTWMASIGDSGMEWDIHPKNKRPVGERLALLARGHVYGEKLLCDAPEVDSAVQSGDKVVIFFKNCGKLSCEDKKISNFEVISGDGERIAVTDGYVTENQVILSGCAGASQVLFAQTGYYEIRIYNEAGIPVKPFVCAVEKAAE